MEIINVFEDDGITTRSKVDSNGETTTSIEKIDNSSTLYRSIDKLLDQLVNRHVVSREDVIKVDMLNPGIITKKLPLGHFTEIQSSVGVEKLTKVLSKIKNR